MEALETGRPLLDLAYETPGLGPINVLRADLGQVGTWALMLIAFRKLNILNFSKKWEFFL